MKNNEYRQDLDRCIGRNLRMTTRVISQYYDAALKSIGLKSTQFAMLNEIYSMRDGISIGELSGLTFTDQTTVTRNIELLRKNGYVDVKTENTDLRRKSITVSMAGKEKLAAGAPLWEDAQQKLQDAIGIEDYKTLLKILSKLREMV